MTPHQMRLLPVETMTKRQFARQAGLLDMMNDTELEGVIAHELGHIKNYDMRVNTIAFALVGIISMIADMFWHISFFGGNDEDSPPWLRILAIVAVILAPIAATLLQLAISRRREYLADATGALSTRYPDGLASALEKIGSFGSALKKPNTATAHMFFANPLKSGVIAGLFSTHPKPIEAQ
jgi:heat shock protein HtpX